MRSQLGEGQLHGEVETMRIDWILILTLAATAADGRLAGASLDQSIKQLPARQRIGVKAYSAYS
jgi:hypothetical protein